MAGRRRNRQGGPSDLQPLIRTFLGLPRQVQIALVIVLVIGGIVAAIVYWREQRKRDAGPVEPPASTSPTALPSVDPAGHVLLGNPSNATNDASNRNNYLVLRPTHALSYNDTNGTPNWVSWRVTRSDLGDAPRKQDFDSDPLLPRGFKVVVSGDYSRSGFDRGHMCPHGDRSASTEMSFATFTMTNIIPQAPNVNQKAWAQLENYSRDMVRKGQRLYITSGPSGKGGVGSNGRATTIGLNGKVTVPATCWKVIVSIPDDGADDASRVTDKARVIAVEMPNDNNAVGEEWASFRISPAEIESKTGYRFFDKLDPRVADTLRQKKDSTYVPPPKPMKYDR